MACGSTSRPRARARHALESDIRWLWAAYHKGLWRDLMDEGYTKDAFAERMNEILSFADYNWILEAKGRKGVRPVGLVLARRLIGGLAIEPHVDWFEWASVRNRAESLIAFVDEVRPLFRVMVFAPADDDRMWRWLTKRGLLGEGGAIPALFGRGRDGKLYYGKQGAES